MLRWNDWNGLGEDVAPLFQAMRPNIREVRGHDLRVDRGETQPLVLGTLFAHLILNGAGHNVARLELVGKALRA